MNAILQSALNELVVANIKFICAGIVCDEYINNPKLSQAEREFAMREKGKIVLDIQDINYIFQTTLGNQS